MKRSADDWPYALTLSTSSPPLEKKMGSNGRDRKVKGEEGEWVERVRGKKRRGEVEKAVSWDELEIHQIKGKLQSYSSLHVSEIKN